MGTMENLDRVAHSQRRVMFWDKIAGVMTALAMAFALGSLARPLAGMAAHLTQVSQHAVAAMPQPVETECVILFGEQTEDC